MSGAQQIRHLRGFSVIEIIIILVILAALLAILFPVISSAREAAKVTACASNLRQIGQAIHSYHSHYHRLPQAAYMPAPFIQPSTPPTPIYELLAEYLSPDSPVYRCPGDAGQVFDRCVAASPAQRGISYGYLDFSKVPYPDAREIRMLEYFGSSKYGPIVPTFHRGGGANVLSRDGSVQFYSGYDN